MKKHDGNNLYRGIKKINQTTFSGRFQAMKRGTNSEEEYRGRRKKMNLTVIEWVTTGEEQKRERERERERERVVR